ncbi:MAG: alpha/beta hydrolase [Planctomycetes bacterium]|nr:alpha/beta hydrolase [Planctomycetota bacterium]
MGFVPHHEIVVADGAAPTRTVFVLHGIFGSGRNWTAFARRFVAASPEWRAVLVHLRGHGGSRDAPGPHTMAACSADLTALTEAVGSPDVVWGHSFGGKVVLQWLRDAPEIGSRQVWSFDSPPGDGPAGGGDPLSSEVGLLITALREIAEPLARRADAQEELRDRGLSRAVAGWMATNLVRRDDGYRWHFDIATLEPLLRDYWHTDLWPLCDHPPADVDVHLVRAADSDRWSDVDRARLDEVASGGGASVHVLPRAGHWLHVDAPQALLTLLLGHLI